MRIVAVSDTHGKESQIEVPAGDVLIHCGDFSKFGLCDFDKFGGWLASQPHRQILITPGNHERQVERDPDRYVGLLESARDGIKVLIHEAFEFEGIKFFGSPWQPWWHDWAYNLPRGVELANKWAEVPSNTDVLFTHTPAHGILDLTGDTNVGCEELRKRVDDIKPKIFICGHIHSQGGQSVEHNVTIFANAAICDDHYQLAHSPRIFEL